MVMVFFWSVLKYIFNVGLRAIVCLTINGIIYGQQLNIKISSIYITVS